MPGADGSQEAMAERFAFGSALIEEAAAVALSYFAAASRWPCAPRARRTWSARPTWRSSGSSGHGWPSASPATPSWGGVRPGRCGGRRGIWVVDPIDGTQPFVSDLTSWCVSIGYVHEGRIEMGFLAAPAREEVFMGWRGHGATLNGRPIHVSRSTGLNDGLLCIGMSPRISADRILAYFAPLLRQGVVYYREGSGALSLAYVAAGRLIGYVEAHLNSWDGLAGVALVEAAGGRVNDFLAGDALWSGGPIVATSPTLYPALAEVLGL